MSATIPQLRDAVVAALSASLTGVNVGTHGGTFEEAELKRCATLAPAVRVCVVGCGATKTYNDGRPYIPVNFAAVVVTSYGAYVFLRESDSQPAVRWPQPMV